MSKDSAEDVVPLRQLLWKRKHVAKDASTSSKIQVDTSNDDAVEKLSESSRDSAFLTSSKEDP